MIIITTNIVIKRREQQPTVLEVADSSGAEIWGCRRDAESRPCVEVPARGAPSSWLMSLLVAPHSTQPEIEADRGYTASHTTLPGKTDNLKFKNAPFHSKKRTARAIDNAASGPRSRTMASVLLNRGMREGWSRWWLGEAEVDTAGRSRGSKVRGHDWYGEHTHSHIQMQEGEANPPTSLLQFDLTWRNEGIVRWWFGGALTSKLLFSTLPGAGCGLRVSLTARPLPVYVLLFLRTALITSWETVPRIPSHPRIFRHEMLLVRVSSVLSCSSCYPPRGPSRGFIPVYSPTIASSLVEALSTFSHIVPCGLSEDPL